MRHRACLARTTFYTGPDRACRRPWGTFGNIWQARRSASEAAAAKGWFMFVDEASPSACRINADGSVTPISREEFYR